MLLSFMKQIKTKISYCHFYPKSSLLYFKPFGSLEFINKTWLEWKVKLEWKNEIFGSLNYKNHKGINHQHIFFEKNLVSNLNKKLFQKIQIMPEDDHLLTKRFFAVIISKTFFSKIHF